MEKQKGFLGFYIIASAIIWGAAIIGCAIILKDTEGVVMVNTILGSASAVHLILIWGPLVAKIKKLRENR